MAIATPFIITNVGLAAAAVAHPEGPFIHITQFRLGNAFNYTPQRTDTGLNGTTVYIGSILTYNYIGDNTLKLEFDLPYSAGNFQFGEVGLYLASGEMFAKSAFEVLQEKISNLTGVVGNRIKFSALIKLAQSTAVIQVTIENEDCKPPLELDTWAELAPPSVAPNDPIFAIIHEKNSENNSTFLMRNENPATGLWVVNSGYMLVRKTTVAANTTASRIYSPGVDFTTSTLGQYLIQTADGRLRRVSSSFQGATPYVNLYSPLPSAPTPGTDLYIYIVDKFPVINLPPMPYPGGNAGTIQYKAGATTFGGSDAFQLDTGQYSNWPYMNVIGGISIYRPALSGGAAHLVLGSPNTERAIWFSSSADTGGVANAIQSLGSGSSAVLMFNRYAPNTQNQMVLHGNGAFEFNGGPSTFDHVVSAVSFNPTSEAALKEDIENMSFEQLETFMKLAFKTYFLKSKGRDRKEIGLIADDAPVEVTDDNKTINMYNLVCLIGATLQKVIKDNNLVLKKDEEE